MNILLINPPARKSASESIVVPPLGLAYLAAAALDAGHEVGLLDAFGLGLDWEAFSRRLEGKSYDVIALTGMTPVIDTTIRAATLCRPYARHMVLGGAHATTLRSAIFDQMPEVDWVVIGEGEETFVEFLRALETREDPTRVPGILGKDGRYGGDRPLIKDVDSIPFPARHLLPNCNYKYPLCNQLPFTTIISSRGCPFKCIFCDKSVFGSKWRARSAENVLAEIDNVVKEHKVKSIVFYDDLFTLENDRLQKICRGLIERQYSISWKAEGRVDIIDEESLKLMRKAGCDTIAYGVETANQHGLNYLHKKTTPSMIRHAFEATRRAGIRTMGYFILGLPVETYDDALRTIDFACEIKADYAQFSVLSPIRGTRIYDEAVSKGWYKEIAAQNVNDKDKLRPVIISENWTEEQLVDIVRIAHRRFYLRPGYILKKMLTLSSFSDFTRMASLGLSVVSYVFNKKKQVD